MAETDELRSSRHRKLTDEGFSLYGVVLSPRLLAHAMREIYSGGQVEQLVIDQVGVQPTSLETSNFIDFRVAVYYKR